MTSVSSVWTDVLTTWESMLVVFIIIHSETILLCSESPRKRIPRIVWLTQWSNFITWAAKQTFYLHNDKATTLHIPGTHSRRFYVGSCSPYGMSWNCTVCGPAHHAFLLQSHHSKVPSVRKSLVAKELGRLQLGIYWFLISKKWKMHSWPLIQERHSLFLLTDEKNWDPETMIKEKILCWTLLKKKNKSPSLGT